MSLITQYRNWSITPTWSGGLGLGSGAATHCRYTLMARGLIQGPGQGIQHTAQPGTTRTVAVNPGMQWRSAPPEYCDYNIQFTGGGFSLIPSFLPGSLSGSWPSCPSSGSRIWHAGGPITASSFNGRGMIIDGSDTLGAGIGFQLLVFNMEMPVLPDINLIRNILEWIETGNIGSVRRHIPMGAVCYGIQFGASLGVTAYFGPWWTTTANTITLPVISSSSAGQALPPGQRPRMGGTRARFERRR